MSLPLHGPSKSILCLGSLRTDCFPKLRVSTVIRCHGRARVNGTASSIHPSHGKPDNDAATLAQTPTHVRTNASANGGGPSTNLNPEKHLSNRNAQKLSVPPPPPPRPLVLLLFFIFQGSAPQHSRVFPGRLAAGSETKTGEMPEFIRGCRV